ncbi:hypothetical protein [Algoriphagus resistens]|uniref:hypothetical protein n=1 Tax=Algoriphagus resistens TaxID=1750590 RepID=UPI000716B43D|nr:hypothetical protein [Algoriphagus resistens]|tara:strand:+ start:3049 stop:3795 length:747 start_codon:yes stop_codon:yes gene_type:complete
MREYLNKVRKYYNNAVFLKDSLNNILNLIEEQYQLKPSQVVMVDSICNNDVNLIHYPPKAYEMIGPFHLGGLDGFPFLGLTGMKKVDNHVSEEGAVLIFYAPHIGVSKDGTTGGIKRTHQHDYSSCCGGLEIALRNLSSNMIKSGEVSSLDYQFNILEQILFCEKERIDAAADKFVEATEVVYEAIERQIDLLISKSEYHCKHLFLVGGIYINGDRGACSFHAVRRIEHLDVTTNQKTDLTRYITFND